MNPFSVSGMVKTAATAVDAVVGPKVGSYVQNAPSLASLVDRVAKGLNVKSLVDVARPARVSPLVFMDASLEHCEERQTILQTIASIFSGYYLQAFNMVCNTKRVETLRVLDSLNPTRGGGSWGDMTSNGQPLALTDKSMSDIKSSIGASTESFVAMGYSMEAGEDKPATALYEQQNMAVGKLLCLDYETNTMEDVKKETKTIDENGNPVVESTARSTPKGTSTSKLYVMVTITPTIVASDVFVNLYGHMNTPRDQSSRFSMFRQGLLRWRDMAFGCDLIDQHRKLLVTDNSGTYRRVVKNQNNHLKASMTSGNQSMAACSNIVIISSATEKRIARELNGRLSSPRVRNVIFDTSYLMLLVVVDEDFNQVTIYTRGIDTPTKASFRDLKSYEKNKGPDITEILATYVKATAPTL